MTVLHEIGLKHQTDKATFHQYLEFYEKHLPSRDFAGRLLEIGIMHGASLRMWREYYPHAEIVGVDNERWPEVDGVRIHRMDATNITLLRQLGDFDVIVDDASHMTADQQVTFFWLFFNQLNPDGLYVMEDLQTSLWPNYINSRYTTIEMLERLGVDAVHFRRDSELPESMTAIIRAERK